MDLSSEFATRPCATQFLAALGISSGFRKNGSGIRDIKERVTSLGKGGQYLLNGCVSLAQRSVRPLTTNGATPRIRLIAADAITARMEGGREGGGEGGRIGLAEFYE